MKRSVSSPPVWLAASGLIVLLAGCSTAKPETETASAGSATATTNTKIWVTTSSDEARGLYTKGRALADQLKAHDARELFEQAAAKDPSFALAHYNLALTSATAKDFLQHLNQAVALSDKASEGERLLILALQAGSNADPTKALAYSEELVAKYPQDERAHFTLAGNYLGQQEYQKAIDELKQSIAINPSFSPAYNTLGYAYRPLENYVESEKAFKKYIELVPDDPNPYDSYAELLMKTGRFDESIAQYRKALSIDPHFSNSYVAIASDLMYQGKHDQAIAEVQKLFDGARDDGDRRLARFTQALIYVDAGKTAKAMEAMQQEYAVAVKIADTASMSADHVAMGNILLDAWKPDEAQKHFTQALDLVTASGQSAEVKEDTRLANHYDRGRVALARKDLKTATSEAAQYLKGAEARHNAFRIRQAHELAGTIALQEKQFDQAISELAQASQQDPYVVYSTALAYAGKGDKAKAQELAGKAANANILPTLHYVFIRTDAKKIG
ncbi:MAG: tetratricopeptide repeat protein [Gemmatimonadales bacterium]